MGGIVQSLERNPRPYDFEKVPRVSATTTTHEPHGREQAHEGPAARTRSGADGAAAAPFVFVPRRCARFRGIVAVRDFSVHALVVFTGIGRARVAIATIRRLLATPFDGLGTTTTRGIAEIRGANVVVVAVQRGPGRHAGPKITLVGRAVADVTVVTGQTVVVPNIVWAEFRNSVADLLNVARRVHGRPTHEAGRLLLVERTVVVLPVAQFGRVTSGHGCPANRVGGHHGIGRALGGIWGADLGKITIPGGRAAHPLRGKFGCKWAAGPVDGGSLGHAAGLAIHRAVATWGVAAHAVDTETVEATRRLGARLPIRRPHQGQRVNADGSGIITAARFVLSR